SFSDVCVNAAAFALSGGAPAGGTYSGTGVNAGNFDPAVALLDALPISYTVTQNGCADFKSANLTVRAAPVVSLASFSDVCVNATAVAHTADPQARGTYSGPGVNASNFDPAAAGVGTHVITYTVTQNGCA